MDWSGMGKEDIDLLKSFLIDCVFPVSRHFISRTNICHLFIL